MTDNSRIEQDGGFRAIGTRGLTGGAVAYLEGVSSSQILNEIRGLRDLGEGLGFMVLVSDPTSVNPSESSIDGLLNVLIDAMQRVRAIDEPLLELFHSYKTLSQRSAGHSAALGRYRLETLGQLVTELSKRQPIWVFAVNQGSASASDRDALLHLSRFVFNDPIHDLSPELKSHDLARGVLFVCDPSGVDVTETLDLSRLAKCNVREFLSRDSVVEQLVGAVQGDVQRLSSLVDQLSENTQSFQGLRLSRLSEESRFVLGVLSHVGSGLSLDRLQFVLNEFGRESGFTSTIRELIDGNWIRRAVSAGEIRVSILEGEVRSAARQVIEDTRDMHRALARAELECGGRTHSPEFVARQFLLAGERSLALEFGRHALSVMKTRGAWEEAIELLRDLEVGDDAELLATRLEAHAALGQYQQALDAGIRLEDLNGDQNLSVRLGDILQKLGDYEGALSRYERVLDHDLQEHSWTRIEAELGRCDVWYALGQHQNADDVLQRLLTELDASDQPFVADRLKLRARNILGKIGIFQSRNEASRSLFAKNVELARHYGWDDELARGLANLGVVALQERDHTLASEYLNQALDASATQGSLPRAYCHVNLATIAQREQKFLTALDHCLEGMRAARRAGDQNAYGIAAHNLATIYQDLGHFDRAHAVIDHLDDGSAKSLAGRWNRRVRGYLHLEARELSAAAEIFEELKTDDFKTALYGPESLLRLAQIHIAMGDLDSARGVLVSLEIPPESGDRAVLETLAALLGAEISMATNGATEAIADTLARAAGILEDASQPGDAMRARYLQALALSEVDRVDDALNLLHQQLKKVHEIADELPAEFKRLFVEKPLHRDIFQTIRDLHGIIPSSLEFRDEAPVEAPSRQPRLSQWRPYFDAIIGEDPRLHQIFRVIDRIAPSNATVLLYGESGTGKELLAEALHKRSDRSSKPMVKINCAAFVENLLLSELFGHEKGAFTGATSQKAGRFEIANGGTIFLDEIGDISPNTQVALLRVLQEGTFERVGGNETLNVDVRVVCATNKNLEEMVQRGEFRLDLYYRLKGVVIESPSLRERRQDIPALVKHFAASFDKGVTRRFDRPVLEFLARYSWPGNIRELQNFVKSVLLFVEGEVVRMEHLQDFKDFFTGGEFADELDFEFDQSIVVEPAASVATPGEEVVEEELERILVKRIVREGLSLSDLKHRLEVESIKSALIESEGNVTRAAELLQMKRPRLSQIINGTDELADLKSTLVG